MKRKRHSANQLFAGVAVTAAAIFAAAFASPRATSDGASQATMDAASPARQASAPASAAAGVMLDAAESTAEAARGVSVTGAPAEDAEDASAASEVIESHTGAASYYASSLHGNRTASGEIYNENELVAAHRSWPFGTRLRVTNLANDRSVLVRVVDRGPFAGRGRVLDLSRRAAQALGFIRAGVANVKVDVLEFGAG